MRKSNLEILRFQVALQDFAKLEIVIHYEQMRLNLLRCPTANFLCLCAPCALIVHDDSGESLLNQDKPARTIPNEQMASPTTPSPVPVNHTMLFRAEGCNLEQTSHLQSVPRHDIRPPSFKRRSSCFSRPWPKGMDV